MTSHGYIFEPAAGIACHVCNGPADLEQSTPVTVYSSKTDSGLAEVKVWICHRCTSRAVEHDGSVDQLVSDILENYAAGVITRNPDEQAKKPPRHISMRRRPLGSHHRRHPAHGKRLLETPPPAEVWLTVATSWESAKSLPAPQIVVLPEDNPARLRFDVAAGRCVRVGHAADADPTYLLKLAQGLIDYGALCVYLIVYPERPCASGEFLLVLPESDA